MRHAPVSPRKPTIEAELQELVDSEFDELSRKSPKAKSSNVIHMREPVEEPEFSPEEQQFVAATARFLRGRQNADMLIESIWSKAMEAAEEKSNDAPAPAQPDKEDDPGERTP